GDLAEAGAADQALTDGEQELGTLQPVGGTEGLLGEVAPAVTTLETLDAAGGGASAEGAGADPAPRTCWPAVEWAVFVGAERGYRGGGFGRHAPGSLQTPHHPQSSEHN